MQISNEFLLATSELGNPFFKAPRLEQEIVPAWMRCGVCGCEWDPAPRPLAGHEALAPALPSFRCPGCELAGAEVVRGDELEVESIEVADETPATAPANQA